MLVSVLRQLLAHFEKCRRFKTTDRLLWRARHEGGARVVRRYESLALEI